VGDRQPEYVTKELVEQAAQQAIRKKNLAALAEARFQGFQDKSRE